MMGWFCHSSYRQAQACRVIVTATFAFLLSLGQSAETINGSDTPTVLESDGVAAQNYSRQRNIEFAAASSHRLWIWEVRRGANRLWIAGCLHLGTEFESHAFHAYLPYYNRATAIYFEVMPGSWESPDVGTLFGHRGFAPDRRSLASRISPESWREIQKVLRYDQILLNRIKPMEPWYASLTVSREGYRRAGLLREYGLDDYLEQRARADGKPVGALEKAQDQVFAMADTNREDQERSLRSALENYQTYDFGSEKIRRAWRTGNEALLRSVFGNERGAAINDEMHVNLLARRNEKWIRKIESIIGSGRLALVVVGVEHLISEPSSLTSLLRAAGFTVERVGGPAPSRTTAVSR